MPGNSGIRRKKKQLREASKRGNESNKKARVEREKSAQAVREKQAASLEKATNVPEELRLAANKRPAQQAKPPICGCGHCKLPSAVSQRRIGPGDWKSGAILGKLPAKQAEIKAHDIEGAFDAKAAVVVLRELHQKEAVLVAATSTIISDTTPPAPTAASDSLEPPSPEPESPPRRRPRGSLSPVPSQLRVTPQVERELRHERHARVVTREEFTKWELPAQAPWNDAIGIEPELRKLYEVGVAALLARQLQYKEYVAFQLFRGLERPLTEREFYGLSVLVLHLSDKLLDEYIDLGLQVSKEAYLDMMRHRGPNYEAHWPLGATEELLRVNKVDGCWAVTGNSSPFGLVCIVDGLTQLLLGAVHFTKQSDPMAVRPPPPKPHPQPTRVANSLRHPHTPALLVQVLAGKPHRFVADWPEASGNMDGEGSKVLVEHLLKTDPEEFKKCILVEDGDTYHRRWQAVPGAEAWICAKCGCHKGKNAAKACKGSDMSGLQCECENLDKGRKRCGKIKDYRWKKEWGHRFVAHWYTIVKENVLLYLPELAVPGARLPADVGSVKREKIRLEEAIPNAMRQTRLMYYHMIGDHAGCSHEGLPDDHPKLMCKVQRDYLWEVLEGLSKCTAEVLTPYGRLDINAVESLNAIIARYRPKGRKWGSVACFLAETLGLLHWQRLQLGFRGHMRNPMVELAGLIKQHLGLTVPYTESDVKAMDMYLEHTLDRKEYNNTDEAKAARKKARARKGGYHVAENSGDYIRGGSSMAVRALVEAPLVTAMFDLTADGADSSDTESEGEGEAAAVSLEDGDI